MLSPSTNFELTKSSKFKPGNSRLVMEIGITAASMVFEEIVGTESFEIFIEKELKANRNVKQRTKNTEM